jgi:hypothetical protein
MDSLLPSSNEILPNYEITNIIIKDNIATVSIKLKQVWLNYVNFTHIFPQPVYYICY